MKGEIELTIVYPGLSCGMLLVVANIGSDGLLGTEALQSCLPHQLDLRTVQLWVEGRSTLKLHQQRLAPKGQAFLRIVKSLHRLLRNGLLFLRLCLMCMTDVDIRYNRT